MCLPSMIHCSPEPHGTFTHEIYHQLTSMANEKPVESAYRILMACRRSAFRRLSRFQLALLNLHVVLRATDGAMGIQRKLEELQFDNTYAPLPVSWP